MFLFPVTIYGTSFIHLIGGKFNQCCIFTYKPACGIILELFYILKCSNYLFEFYNSKIVHHRDNTLY